MASQSIYVDLDVKGNKIQNVAPAVGASDVPNLDQVADLISSAVTTASHVPAVEGVGILPIDDTQVVAVDQSWLATFVADNAANNIEAGGGIAITEGEGTGGADVIAVDASVVRADGSVAFTAVQTGVNGTAATHLATKGQMDTADATLQGSITANANAIAAEVTARTDADALKADKSITLTAGNGLAGGGDLSANRGFDVGATDATIVVESDGIKVGVVQQANIATGAVGNLQNGSNLYSHVDVVRGTTDPASAVAGHVLTFRGGTWGGEVIPAATVGSVTGTAGETDVTQNGTEWQVGLVPAITDAISTATSTNATQDTRLVALETNTHVKAVGTTGQTTVDPATQVVGIDAAYTTARDAYADTVVAAEAALRTTGDADLGTRIDGISITGAGMAIASVVGDNQWTVDVPALALANTYTGTTGVDSATINTDLANQGVTELQPGDLYINSADGRAFINSAPVGPTGVWTELATAAVGIDSIAGGDGSITVTNGAGPNADVALSAALQSAISVSTASNVAQDARLGTIEGVNTAQNGRLDALEAVDHVAASAAAGSAITVGATDQVVALGLASPELTQSAAGLAINLTGYTTDAELATLDGRVTAAEADIVLLEAADVTLQSNIDAEAAIRATNDGLLQDAIEAEEASRIATDGSLQTQIDAVDADLATEINDRIAGDNALDARIDTLEAKHPAPASVNLTGGTLSQVVTGPAGAAVTVRDAGGCIATLQVCETAPGSYTVSANVDFSGTIAFG